MDSDSDLEVPYAMNFSPDENDGDTDDSSSHGGCYESPGKDGREPLRAGDVIAYTNPVFTAGSRQGSRRAVVITVQPNESRFPLVLDNAEHLPWDTPVQRIGEFYKGKVYPHAGRIRPISSFLLKSVKGGSKTETSADVLRRQAAQLKQTLQAIETRAIRVLVGNDASGDTPIGDTSNTTNRKRKRTSLPSSSSSSHSSSLPGLATQPPTIQVRSSKPRASTTSAHDESDNSSGQADDLLTQDVPFYVEYKPSTRTPSTSTKHKSSSIGGFLLSKKNNVTDSHTPEPTSRRTHTKAIDLEAADPSIQKRKTEMHVGVENESYSNGKVATSGLTRRLFQQGSNRKEAQSPASPAMYFPIVTKNERTRKSSPSFPTPRDLTNALPRPPKSKAEKRKTHSRDGGVEGSKSYQKANRRDQNTPPSRSDPIDLSHSDEDEFEPPRRSKMARKHVVCSPKRRLRRLEDLTDSSSDSSSLPARISLAKTKTNGRKTQLKPPLDSLAFVAAAGNEKPRTLTKGISEPRGRASSGLFDTTTRSAPQTGRLHSRPEKLQETRRLSKTSDESKQSAKAADSLKRRNPCYEIDSFGSDDSDDLDDTSESDEGLSREPKTKKLPPIQRHKSPSCTTREHSPKLSSAAKRKFYVLEDDSSSDEEVPIHNHCRASSGTRDTKKARVRLSTEVWSSDCEVDSPPSSVVGSRKRTKARKISKDSNSTSVFDFESQEDAAPRSKIRLRRAQENSTTSTRKKNKVSRIHLQAIPIGRSQA